MSTQQRASQPDANNSPSKDEKHAAEQPVLESASATTSPNNKSGVGAYIVVGVVLAILVAIALAICNLVAAVGTSMDLFEEYENSYGNGYGLGDLDDFLDDYDDQDAGTSSGRDLTQDDALDQYFICVETSINDYVFASDYSGAQQPVTGYVKALASADAASASQVKSHLRAAAAATTDDATRASELEAAADAATAAYQTIEALALPTEEDLTGSKAADVIEYLASGREDALARWEKISQVVAMIQSPSGHTTRELSDLDDEAGEVTDAALELTHALSDSASYK